MCSYIDAFIFNDEVFEHVIFTDEDDRVECRDGDGKVRLTYTTNCRVLDGGKKLIGRWSMPDNQWIFIPEGEGQQRTYGRDLLKAEVEVSKLYIAGTL